ncbi:MAG: phosphoribosylanthranilate isomerase [Polyangiaceae bacterium]|nr:phosphoribosylanthranilate isomerase [Polyangiaceae bacterium]
MHVKVSGLRSAEQGVRCVELGATAIGLNFCEGSSRRISAEAARRIARAVRDSARARSTHVDVVGIVANMPIVEMRALAGEAELDCLELAGDETCDIVAALLPRAYKAARVATEGDVMAARTFPGDYLLVRATVESVTAFGWPVVRDLARTRKLTLAGGLHAGNVRAAVAAVRPFCVDAASGVEQAPGRIDFAKVEAFIAEAKNA